MKNTKNPKRKIAMDGWLLLRIMQFPFLTIIHQHFFIVDIFHESGMLGFFLFDSTKGICKDGREHALLGSVIENIYKDNQTKGDTLSRIYSL